MEYAALPGMNCNVQVVGSLVAIQVRALGNTSCLACAHAGFTMPTVASEPVDAEHRQREASISHGASISRHVARPAPHQPEPRCSARSPLITAPSQLSAAALHHARRNPLRPGPLRGDLPRAAALRGRR